MPTYERRYYIDNLKKENEAQREHMQNRKNNAGNQKGHRTTTISDPEKVKAFASSPQNTI
jgi:hypothetical protein